MCLAGPAFSFPYSKKAQGCTLPTPDGAAPPQTLQENHVQVTATFRDNLGRPVNDEVFAAFMSRSVGISLLPHLTYLDEALVGEWQVRLPEDVAAELAVGPVALDVNFPLTDLSVGFVAICGEHETALVH